MPKLMNLSCAIELGMSNTPLKEYGARYSDGAVETFVAIPSSSGNIPFSISLHSHDYIAPGLAMFVYIDGKYQCNRHKHGLRMPAPDVPKDETLVGFRVRQKEEMTRSKRFMGRQWTFAKLNVATADQESKIDSAFTENVGTIEVLVLRTKNGGVNVPTPQEDIRDGRDDPSVVSDSKRQEDRASKKISSSSKVRSVQSEGMLGGMFGLFDGACDDLDCGLDGAGDGRVVHGDYGANAIGRGSENIGSDGEDVGVSHGAHGRRLSVGWGNYIYLPASDKPAVEPDKNPAHVRFGSSIATWKRDDTSAVHKRGQEVPGPRYALDPTVMTVEDSAAEARAPNVDGEGRPQVMIAHHYYDRKDNETKHERMVRNLREKAIRQHSLDQHNQAPPGIGSPGPPDPKLLGYRDRGQYGPAEPQGYVLDRQRPPQQQMYYQEQYPGQYFPNLVPHPQQQALRLAPPPQIAQQQAAQRRLNPFNQYLADQSAAPPAVYQQPVVVPQQKMYAVPQQQPGTVPRPRVQQRLPRDIEAFLNKVAKTNPQKAAAQRKQFLQQMHDLEDEETEAPQGGGFYEVGKGEVGGGNQWQKQGGFDRTNKHSDTKSSTAASWGVEATPGGLAKPVDQWPSAGQSGSAGRAQGSAHKTSTKHDDNVWGAAGDNGNRKTTIAWSNDQKNSAQPDNWQNQEQKTHGDEWPTQEQNAHGGDGGWENVKTTSKKVKSAKAASAAGTAQTSHAWVADDTSARKPSKHYWVDIGKTSSSSKEKSIKPAEPREVYKYPALPAPAVPENHPTDATHGVQVGKGAAYSHRCGRPIYLDTLDSPYAVFKFKYRSKAALEKILGRKIDEDMLKITREVEESRLRSMPKDKLVEELIKAKSPGFQPAGPASTQGGSKHGVKTNDFGYKQPSCESDNGASAVRARGWGAGNTGAAKSKASNGGWGFVDNNNNSGGANWGADGGGATKSKVSNAGWSANNGGNNNNNGGGASWGPDNAGASKTKVSNNGMVGNNSKGAGGKLSAWDKYMSAGGGTPKPDSKSPGTPQHFPANDPAVQQWNNGAAQGEVGNFPPPQDFAGW